MNGGGGGCVHGRDGIHGDQRRVHNVYGWSYRQFVHLSYGHWVHLMWVLRVEPEPFEEQCTLLTTEP